MGARGALVAALAAAALAGCGGDDEAEVTTPSAPDTISLSSPNFKNDAPIPAANTCDGAGKPPTIVWRAIPPESVELVFVVDDPDAPDGTFTHWTAFGLTAATGSGLAPDGQFPTGVKQGRNSAGKNGWTPPCPPEGDDPHRYVFTMYAIPKATGLEDGADREAVQKVIDTAIAYGRFTGTYKRAG